MIVYCVWAFEPIIAFYQMIALYEIIMIAFEEKIVFDQMICFWTNDRFNEFEPMIGFQEMVDSLLRSWTQKDDCLWAEQMF